MWAFLNNRFVLMVSLVTSITWIASYVDAQPFGVPRSATAGLSAEALDTCAEIAAILGDETGTCGGVVLSNSPTFDDDITLGAVASAADAGAVRLANAASVCFEASPAGTDGCMSFNSGETFTLDAPLAVTGLISATTNIFVPAGGEFNFEGTAGDSSISKVSTTTVIRDDSTTSVTFDGANTVFGGAVTSAGNDAGWSVVDQTDNQACTTGCTTACLFGLENASGSALTGIVSCAATTSDLCVCMGAN